MPWRSLVRPMVSIAAAHRRRYTHEARHHARTRIETWRSNETGQRHRHSHQPDDQAAEHAQG